MIAKIFLCLLVGYAAASHYAWKPNVQYTYQVVGRTLSGLNDQDTTMSGIFTKAELVIVPKTEETLTARIQHAQYSPVQMRFESGWDAEVPESKLQYQPLKISSAPFEIHLQNGIVKDIVVSKELQNWEANMIKAIVSQLQLNVNGRHAIDGEYKNLPQQNSNFGVFKVMEQTVTGEFETTYVMRPEREQVWPLIERSNESRDNEAQNIVISKSKNFTAHGVLVGYHHGFARLGDWEPNTDSMGSFMNRSSVSNAVIYGNLNDYTIKSSNTSNVISFNPQFNNDKAGMIASQVCIIFRSMEPSKPFDAPQEPTKVGIFYQYNSADGSNKVQKAQEPRRINDEDDVYNRPAYFRLNSISQKSQEYSLDQSEQQLSQPPQHSMNPISGGYFGQSVKHSEKVDAVRAAEKLAKEIAQELRQPNEMLQQGTVAKFAVLVRLTRTMNQQEMEQVAQALYTKETQGEKTDAWKVYRDAVAQSATGPALLTIQDWINKENVREEEAAELVATMAESARHPTIKYLRAFKQLVETTAEKKYQTVNDTAAISFADLLFKVCVDKEESYQQFPFHTYGSYSTEQCQHLAEEYVKYLEGRLEKAVAKSDSHKVLVYIRALGNCGHRDIYRSFQKYLSQTAQQRSEVPEYQQVTEFQRFTIVSAMDRFAQLYPEVARQILLNIYFSPSEQQEIRTLAAYTIASTRPDSDVLSAMAQYTEVDTNEYVNSAVKSAIRTLVAEEYEPAREAERLLTRKHYGTQYPQAMLSEYVNERMNTEYKHYIETLGSVETIIPKSLGYKFRVMLGDAKYQLALKQYIVSSIDDLVNAFEQQTEQYQQQVHQKKSESQDQEHDSNKVYSTLGIKIEEREQLEGLLRVSMGQAERFFTINNYTVDNITEFAQHWEHQLKNGRQVSLNKMIVKYESVLSAPTEMGLPYVFNSETPTLFRLNGKIQADAQPEISNGDVLRAPEQIKAQAELRALVSKVSFSAIRFYTPFDHQDYASGYNKEMQAYLPVKCDVKVDLASNKVSATVRPIEPEQETKLFQYRTIPYNVRRDILNLKPLCQESHFKILKQQTPNVHVTPIGHKSIGMTFQIRRESDNQQLNINDLLQRVQRRGISALKNIIFDNEILYSDTEFSYQGRESANREVKLRFNWARKHFQHQEGSAPSVEELLSLPAEQQERTKQVAQKAAANIKSVKATVGDMEIEFVGQKEVKIQAGAAYARGPVDKQSRFVAYIKKESKSGEIKPFYFAAVQSAETPNTNGLDLEYAMKFDPTIKSQAHIVMGEEKNQLARIEINARFEKTEERVEYLNNLPASKECRKQMQQERNHIMPVCSNLTAQANLLDDVSIRVKHSGLSRVAKQLVQKAFDLLRPCRNNEFAIEHLGEQKDGEVQLKLRFSPDLRSANYSAEGTWATNLRHVCERIPVNRWQRQIFVLHPVFPVVDRLEAEALRIDTYRPICVVDKTRAATFDGKEYEAKLSQDWTVMLQHLPHFTNQSDRSDLKYRSQQQIREHVVLVRSESNGKAVKLSIRVPRTQQKLAEVELRPTGQSNPRVKVIVDNQEVKYDQHQSRDFHNRAIRVYGLPNDEVKVEIDEEYYVIADGRSVKLTTTSTRFNNATRGLCGNLNGMDADDFILPNGQIEEQNEERFVQAYNLKSGGLHLKSSHGQQRQQKAIFLPIMTYNEAREIIQGEEQWSNGQQHSCTGHRRIFVQTDNKDCFTVREYPVCKPGCQAQNRVMKSVEVKCFQHSAKTQSWRNQVREGKQLQLEGGEDKTAKLQLATECKH